MLRGEVNKGTVVLARPLDVTRVFLLVSGDNFQDYSTELPDVCI